MRDDARRILLWGLEAVAWVFRGADGGRWSRVQSDCLPRLAELLLFLESRRLIDGLLLDHADKVLALADRQAPAMSPENLEAEYVRLFVNHRGGAGVPLSQSCYVGEGLMMGEPAVTMQFRLDRAGLKIDASLGMPPDHIAIELAFLAALLAEQPEPSDALRDGNFQPCDSSGERCEDSPSRFAAEVLAPWVGELRNRAIEAQASPLFHLAVSILVALTDILKHEKFPFSTPAS